MLVFSLLGKSYRVSQGQGEMGNLLNGDTQRKKNFHLEEWISPEPRFFLIQTLIRVGLEVGGSCWVRSIKMLACCSNQCSQHLAEGSLTILTSLADFGRHATKCRDLQLKLMRKNSPLPGVVIASLNMKQLAVWCLASVTDYMSCFDQGLNGEAWIIFLQHAL